MNIFLINESTVLSDDEISATMPAMLVYSRHIRSWWGTMQPGLFFGAPNRPNAWKIVFVDDADQAGALGYHDVEDGERPIGFVFAKTSMDYGYDWQITFSHEFAEMLMDPYIMRCEQATNTRFYALELCDPVEADDLSYTITANGTKVRVSDFVTPMWFVPGSEGPKYDHLGHCTKPLEVLDGGYAYYYENGNWYSEDHLGKKYSVAEFKALHPEKSRLELYARDRG